jgi:hypothetical protein
MLGGPQTFATPGLQARYLWFMLPGPFRILSLCEFQAWQKQPYVWRKLSGTYNAALNGKATQSSTLAGLTDGPAARAVDGLVTNRLDGALPYTVSNTNTGENPGPWWQVDFNQVVDVQSVIVFARVDCCGAYNGNENNTVKASWNWPATVPVGTVFNTAFMRNWLIKWAIGMTTDWTQGSLCSSAPNDITPVRAGPINASNNFGSCMDLPVSVCANEPNCYMGSNVVTVADNPQTACFVKFPCATRGRFLTAYKTAFAGAYATWDQNRIVLGEVQVIANKLLNMPAARTGAAVSRYAGCMVIFGGADAYGYRLNDLRFFDMLRNIWLPPFPTIGTTPSARAFSTFLLLPPTQAGAPSNSLVVFGGSSNVDSRNDAFVLTLPQCPTLSSVGVASSSCTHGGTVCYFTCAASATSTNGAAPLVCDVTGTWRGNSPPCQVAAPSSPLSVSATVSANGVATVSWSAPSSGGFYGISQISSYKVQVTVPEANEYYNAMAFPAWQPAFAGPEAGCTGSSPCTREGSAYVGGNWYRLLEKNGAGPWLNYVATNNAWDFWQGWLRLNSDIGRNNWVCENCFFPVQTQPNSHLLIFCLSRPTTVRQQRQHGPLPRHARSHQSGWQLLC